MGKNGQVNQMNQLGQYSQMGWNGQIGQGMVYVEGLSFIRFHSAKI